MDGPCGEALGLLVDRVVAPARRPAPWPAVAAARTDVEGLLAAWDDAVADRLFAMNVALDEDLASRRAAIERLRAVHGALRPDPSEPPTVLSPADIRWWMIGERGRVLVEMLLSPERPPRVQSLELTSIPDPPSGLTEIAERVVALLDGPGPAWPDEIALGDGLDRPALDRELRATEAVFGPLTLGPAVAGDGVREASWRLSGARGDVTLAIEIDSAGGTVRKLTLIPITVETPIHLV
jgi:hypothetical protein